MRDWNTRDKIGVIALLGFLVLGMLVICIAAIFEIKIPGICVLLGAMLGACIEWFILVIKEIW